MKRALPRPQTALCRQGQAARTAWPWPTPAAAASRPLSASARRHAPPPSPPAPAPAATRPSSTQSMPRGGYYDVLLTDPPPYGPPQANKPPKTAAAAPEEPTPATAAPAAPATPWKPGEAPALVAAKKAAQQQQQTTVQQRAALVFGSRLAGPMERANRLAEIRKRSRRIAGVLVPPKPTEPDNCCMSGCVNCVWDRFRDEMEEWAAASAEATRRLRAQEGGVAAGMPAGAPSEAGGSSMDDDGGGSDAHWSLEDMTRAAVASPGAKGWDEELYKGVPVGIREFMKQEKRLKLKHLQEAAGRS